MKKLIPVFLLMVIVIASSCKSKKKDDASSMVVSSTSQVVSNQQMLDGTHSFMFYNLENLFDTIDNEGVMDEEFLPTSKKHYGTKIYNEKLHNMAKVFADVAKINDNQFPIVIGVAEVENKGVLVDLLNQPSLKNSGLDIMHRDSRDIRGIDVAFLYRADLFNLQGMRMFAIPQEPIDGHEYITRDVISMWGTISNEKFFFMCCHWPSRRGGSEASDFRRVDAAKVVHHIADSLKINEPDTRVVMMGDFNDDPFNNSLYNEVGGKGTLKEAENTGYFNPFYAILNDGVGTLRYNGKWNLFDNILVSTNLVDGKKGTLQLLKDNQDKYYGFTFRAPYLFNQSGKYKGGPHRSWAGPNWLNGYSDHLPVYVHIGLVK
ncbi:MAG: endonuclease/exonuclease/phosphatase family protein [Bacteroidaceae bacterium]